MCMDMDMDMDMDMHMEMDRPSLSCRAWHARGDEGGSCSPTPTLLPSVLGKTNKVMRYNE